jgi:hypothetical protein
MKRALFAAIEEMARIADEVSKMKPPPRQSIQNFRP